MRRFLKYHIPAILYAALILALSSIPDFGKSPIGILKFDKVIHLIEYAVFAALIFRSFSNISSRVKSKYVLYFSLLFVALFAILDEMYQGLVPGRHSDIYDLLFDVLGATLVIVLLRARGIHSPKKNAPT